MKNIVQKTPGSNTGHGYVWKRPDGQKARCGGPSMCRECAQDLAASKFKPMRASYYDQKHFQYPGLVSIKSDGIRCIRLHNCRTVSKSLKPIPNTFVIETLDRIFGAINCIEGELVMAGGLNKTTSGIMTKGYHPIDFEFHVFDSFANPDAPFEERQKRIYNLVAATRERDPKNIIKVVGQHEVASHEEMIALHDTFTAADLEGSMVRSKAGRYKFGTSTAREGFLLKHKDWQDSEAVVLSFEESMTNMNPAKKNELGRTARSSSKEGLVPAGTLGSMVCDWNGKIIKLGAADEAMAEEVWANRDKYKGQLAKFKYLGVGSKGGPRHAQFIGWRHPEDMSA